MLLVAELRACGRVAAEARVGVIRRICVFAVRCMAPMSCAGGLAVVVWVVLCMRAGPWCVWGRSGSAGKAAVSFIAGPSGGLEEHLVDR